MKTLKLISLLIASFIMIGCSATSVKNTWKNPSFSTKEFKKVLVIGVHQDVTTRTEYESTLATKLNDSGINAVSASSIKALRGDRTKEKVIEFVKNNSFDTVLVTRYQALKQEEIYKPAYTEYHRIGYRGFFDPFYHNSMLEIHHPGYVVDRETLFLEVSLFETNEGIVVWRGITESVSPGSINVVDEVTTAITKKLKFVGIFN